MNNYINRNKSCNMDCGPEPFVTNISNDARCNMNFRNTIWTGKHLQCTVMCIPEGEDIGLEKHPDTDQCLLIECGRGMCCMGPKKDRLNFQKAVCEDSCVFVPAGMWHNIVNTGRCPLKICSFYAPPEHPHGTVQCSKADAERDEEKEKPKEMPKDKDHMK